MDPRKKMRLEGYDYSRNGVYFVTICTQDREGIFWNTAAGNIRPYGFYDHWRHETVGKQTMRLPHLAKGFYDHIVRDEHDFLTKWNYIDTNAVKWSEDRYYREE